MKRSAIQCVAGLVGATLVVGGVCWTCRQLSSPTQVNAAPDVASSQVAAFVPASSETASSDARFEGSLTLSPARSTTPAISPAVGTRSRVRSDERSAIRSTSGSELTLSLLDEADADATTPADETTFETAQTFAVEPQAPETFDAASPVPALLDDFPTALDAAAPLETPTLAETLEAPVVETLDVPAPAPVEQIAPVAEPLDVPAPVEPVGTGVPGDKKLEGAQTTQVVVEKIAPKEIQVDREAKFAVKVKNVGSAPVRNLVLRDVLPVGARFVAADVASVVPNARGEFAWPPFDLPACSEKTFEYRIIPTQEGEIGSVATVAFAAEASCRVRCVRPALEVEVVAPQEATLGANIDLNVVVANVGTGAATNVALLETIPDGLRHPSGSVLDHALGTLAPGEKKRVPLTLQCVAPGSTVNNLVVTADGDLREEIQTEIVVRAPKLELSIDGAATPYLERQTTYRLNAANVGDATARDVKLVAEIPDGTTFVSANNLGVYQAETRSVYWDLAELPAGAAGEIELTLTPTKIGAARLTFGGTGPLGLTAQVVKNVTIDGLPALSYSVKTSPNPVEVGKEIVYEIQLANRGTKASTNATLQIAAPDALKIVSVEGPTRYSQQNGAFVFDVVREIPAKSAVTYKVKAVCEAVGDCRVRFQLSSDDLEPLVKEENVRVYR